MNRSSRKKINKETQVLNDTLDQTTFIDIYRVFHSKAAEYTLFSRGHGTFSRINDRLGSEGQRIPGRGAYTKKGVTFSEGRVEEGAFLAGRSVC